MTTEQITGIRDADAFEKGTWQAALVHSARLHDSSTTARKRSGTLLWQGAQAAIGEWESDTDANAEALYGSVLEILGAARKGDASKIKTVALAVRNKGLVLTVHKNLSQAYAEANRLTKVAETEAAQDTAADAVIESLAEAAPKSATTAESAALILLSKGIDGAVVAILDALGKDADVHRAFMRAVSTEIAARVQAAKPKPAPKPTVAEKNAAKRAEAGAKPTRATAKDGASKSKPTPVSKSKGDPNNKALPPKQQAAVVESTKPEAEPVSEPVEAGTSVTEPDVFEEYAAPEGTPIGDSTEDQPEDVASTDETLVEVPAAEVAKPASKPRRRPVAVKA